MKRTSNIAADGVVGLVETLLSRALEARASDVHFEPTDRELLVRFRLDGVLHDCERLPKSISDNVIARLKVLAGLLTYRVDIPQEGSIPAAGFGADDRAPRDMRVATFPTVRGERAVVRIFYTGQGISELDELGLTPEAAGALRAAVERPSGMIVVTGPAGSGKSTTLYALARHILRASPGRSVVALEDPVEQRVDGLAQIQIAPHGELDYPRALRSILRQDPQVLLVGEVRDAPTATIVVEAALTGHLLLTTMHSGDPAEALVRLLEMGVAPYQVVSTVGLVATQRLVRVLCRSCRQATGRADEPFVHAGCDICHGTGYQGRTACAQLMRMDPMLRAAVLARATAERLRELAVEQGSSLAAEADRLVREGGTDRDEVRRVIGL